AIMASIRDAGSSRRKKLLLMGSPKIEPSIERLCCRTMGRFVEYSSAIGLPAAGRIIGRTLVLRHAGHLYLRQIAANEFQLADRDGQLHVDVKPGLQQLQIDLLLDVHVPVVIRRLHDVDHLEGQLALVEGEEVGPVEVGLVHALDDAAHLAADLPYLFHRRIRADTEGEHDPPGVHALVVMHYLRQQIGVGVDTLLDTPCAAPGVLKTDMLYGAS